MYCLGGAQIDLGAMSKHYNGREYPGHYGGGDYFSFLNKMSNTRQMNLLAISLRVTLMYDDQHKTSILFHHHHSTVINLTQPQTDTLSHHNASCKQLCLFSSKKGQHQLTSPLFST